MKEAGIVNVVLTNDRRHIGKAPSQFGEADVESKVDQVIDQRVPPGLAPGLSAKGCRRVRDRDAAGQCGKDRFVIGRRHAHVPLTPAFVYQDVVAAYQTDGGIAIQTRDLELQPLGVAPVIEVLARDVFAACLSHAVVIRRRGAQTAGSEDANPPILSRNLLKSWETAVSGSIVHQYELEIVEGLSQNPGNGAIEVRLTVKNGADHAHPGRHARASRSGLRAAGRASGRTGGLARGRGGAAGWTRRER